MNMKKGSIAIVSILALTAALSASADGSANQEIPANQIKNYAQAIQVALNSDAPCKYTDGGDGVSVRDLFVELSNANHGSISTNGAQPVLRFINSTNPQEEEDFLITTSSDYKSVLQIELDIKEMEPVNQGTLIAPNVVQQMVQVDTVFCK